ncbi:hypothetical protein CKM354_000694000 [Cercospora kikuchii]|uniref:Uncharacterized protein n=1 Tax=Cercospora kikuchii TaxID=84275 RepID=A0A9P3CST6_9PEZI|nr:uncharacterized protein CKM354_000694000 [Cercospora kikuchii]GIZ43723.1 hypothetical protein CKM354_000694000 [Cercospora kikuchii]
MHRLPRAISLRQQQLLRPNIRSRIPQQRFNSRIAYKRNGEPVRYQAVRFRGRGPSMRQIVTYGVYGACVYWYFGMVVKWLGVEVEMLDEMVDEEMEGDEEEEVEDDGYAHPDSLFIPLTWSTKLPRTFYRGSDPEWQEFIKIAKDKERHTKIQNELVQLIFKECLKHPGVARQLGKDNKIGKYWLDISFPDGPPQEYERSGIEIADTYIAWSQQKISPEDQWRLTRTIWPKAAFDSLWATSSMLAGINYRRIKQALGWEDKDPFSPEERMRHAIEMHNKQHHPELSRKQVGQGQLEPNANPEGANGSSNIQPAKSTSDEAKKLSWWMVDVPMPKPGEDSMDVPIAMSVFQSTLRKNWNPKKMEPPRGTFVVQGLVEVRGQRGRMMFDVQSCYDPKEAKFTNVNANVRSFKRWNQAPRGGP